MNLLLFPNLYPKLALKSAWIDNCLIVTLINIEIILKTEVSLKVGCLPGAVELHQPKSTVVSAGTLCADFSGAGASALTVC